MRIGPALAVFTASLMTALPGRAEEDGRAKKPIASRGPTLGEADVQKWNFGLIVTAPNGSVGRLTGTTTVPMKWPEQGLKLVSQDVSPGVTVAYKSYGTATQMVVNIPRVADGEEVRAILTMEITRHTILPPNETDLYVVPDAKSLPAEVKQFLNPSPLIESNHARIKAIAEEIGKGQTMAWPHVRAIYDWVRKKIQYQKKAPLTGCLEAIDRGRGDCNELTSAFIAICRASGIPSRTVQIPGHCYPEFYLQDDQGRGHWFPAEASGTEAFGGILTHTPILQKGDAFRISVPDTESRRPRMKTETFRLLPSNLTGTNSEPGGGQPTLKLVCEPADDER